MPWWISSTIKFGFLRYFASPVISYIFVTFVFYFMFVFYILAVAVIYCLEMYIIRVGLFCRNVFITNVNNTFMAEFIYAFNIISWSVWFKCKVAGYLHFLNHYHIFKPSKRNLPASFLHTTVGWGTPVTLQGKVISCPSTTSSSCGFVTHSGGTVVIKSSKEFTKKV